MADKNKKTDHFDAVSMLESENFRILDMILQLKDQAMQLQNEIPESELFNSIKDLFDQISKRVLQFNRLEEEILFPELDWVLPFPSSTESFREEHRQILEMLTKLNEILYRKNTEVRTGKIQSLVLSLYNILERDIHKKNEILFYEAQTMLKKETLEDIYDLLKKKVKLN